MRIHLHLDALGGVAGDMFAAALLDCRPELAQALPGVLAAAGFDGLVDLDIRRHNDGVLEGRVFQVREASHVGGRHEGPAHEHDEQGHHEPEGQDTSAHSHRRFSDIRRALGGSALSAAVKEHALGIFHCLARAEADVHGVEVDEVSFHEVGAWDSIADVVCAAFLIDALGIASCSVSSLPIGRGWITSAHGRLPVPPPAVSLLLEGYAFHDDGLQGERVTPTGAAILRYLRASQAPFPGSLRLGACGVGFGARRFAGLSNVLRAMLLEEEGAREPWLEENIVELSFEIDDQSAEELALGLERIRSVEGVLDVCQYAVQGKKQRQAAGVRVLLRPPAREAVIRACFNETSTLGVRVAEARRAVLARLQVEVEKDGRAFRAKLAQRPNGLVSVKAEADDLAAAGVDHLERRVLRSDIESLAFDKLFGQDDED